MNVLSLFDGISGAKVALNRLGVPCTYFASEIDKYAIQISEKNHPDIIQLGDVTKINPLDLPKIDLLIGGSPCQDLSVAGRHKGLAGERSGLFYEYIWLLSALQPDYFLLENVRMKKAWEFVFNIYTGVKPILIDSALVSGQQRRRLYWTNIPNVTQPEDRKIFLGDVIEDGVVDRDKSYCIDASYYKGNTEDGYIKKCRRQIVYLYRLPHGYVTECTKQYDKYPSLAAQNPDTKYKIVDEFGFRKLTPVECERLQTYDDGYTEGVSNTQRYKCLGNSFTVDVIKHILSFMGESQ